jgi:hypothetical protein
VSNFYNLFLDETKFYDNGRYLYGIAGLAIEKAKMPDMGKRLGKLKAELWKDDLTYTQAKNIVLHMSDIRSGNCKFDEHYTIFKSRENIRTLFKGVGEIIESIDMTVFGSMVNLSDLSEQYKTKSSFYIGDQMCMENIINNYTCFLKHHNSRGKIIFESRADKSGNKSDRMLQKQFYKIITHGTRMYKALEIQDVISDIRFVKKQENNAGLQIADFVPTHFMMNFCDKPQHKINIYKTLKKQRYSGYKTKGQRYSNKFGVTYIR